MADGSTARVDGGSVSDALTSDPDVSQSQSSLPPTYLYHYHPPDRVEDTLSCKRLQEDNMIR